MIRARVPFSFPRGVFAHLAVVAAIGLAGPTHAESLDDVLPRAARAFATGKFKQTVAMLEKAIRDGGTPKSTAAAYRYIAASYVALGKTAQATAAMRSGIESDGAFDFDPRRFPPAVVDLFRRVKDGLRGRIDVRCDRDTAEVEIDEKPAGRCGQVTETASGPHRVRVRSQSRSEVREISVRAGQTEIVSVEFGPLPGRLSVATAPAGAMVTLDGAAVRATPLDEFEVVAGKHEVTITRPGFKAINETIVIVPGRLVTRVYVLEREAPLPTSIVAPAPTPTPLTTSATARATATPRTRTTRTWGWSLLGVGVATAIGGIVGHVVASDINAEAAALRKTTDVSEERAASDASRIRTAETLGNIAFVVGGASLIAGGVLLVLDRTASRTTALANSNISVASTVDASGRVVPLVVGRWRLGR